MANPQPIFLDEQLTVPAANPQTLDPSGRAFQGTIYMSEAPVKYSLLLRDAEQNQIFNIPSTVGVNIPSSINEVPAVIVIDSITVRGLTDSKLIIDSGVALGSEGTLEYHESTVPQWEWLRKAIIDSGDMILRRIAGAGSPDEPISFPYLGGMIARWLGTVRIQTTALGTSIFGLINNNKQVVVAAGTFLHDGTPVGANMGITSVGNTGVGTYVVTLDFFPVAEVDLVVMTGAEVADLAYITYGRGGANASGTVLVFTQLPGTGAVADVDSLTVLVFDMGRV